MSELQVIKINKTSAYVSERKTNKNAIQHARGVKYNAVSGGFRGPTRTNTGLQTQ